MELKLTNEEIEAIKFYRNNIDSINRLLIVDSREDVAILNDEHDEPKINYRKENVIKYLDIIKIVYKIIITSYMNKIRKKNWTFYYIEKLPELQRLKNEPYIDRFLILKSKQEFEDMNLASNQVIVNVNGDESIPYINLNDILKDGNDEILISLFTKIKNIEQVESQKVSDKDINIYNLNLEMQELQEMSDVDKNGLYNYIISNSDLINTTLFNSAELEKENTSNYEGIRNLEKQISDLENEINNKEIHQNYNEEDNNKLKALNEELEKLKSRSAEIFDNIKNNNKIITDWKKNITVYLMVECSNIKRLVLEEKKIEADLESERIKTYEVKERKRNENLAEEKFEKIFEEVQLECADNEVLVKRLIENINMLINRQQNYAKIAGSIGASYSALNNAFEMKKNAEELEDLVNDIKSKAQETFEKGEEPETSNLLLKISEVNNQVTILINYLNNPKTTGMKQKMNRFDEMLIVEENEFKRDVAKIILNVRSEAELKKLRDDTKIIEGKSLISKIFGIFTGQNKLDDFMLEQIEIRENAIKKTLSKNLRLDYNYSIHELIADIRIFIKDNENDDLVAEDIIILKDIENEIKKSFIIIESKVNDIIDEKEHKNLPISNKVSRKELIEIETYRFLNKYGYDIENQKEIKETLYTDTTAKEIARISEYISTSNILDNS